MLIFRTLMFVLLGGSVLCFGMYIATGQARYKNLGIAILKWTVIAGFGFFGVLIASRMA